MFTIETILNVWFTIELALRFLTCSAKFDFIKNWLNIIDVVAILPYYFMLSASSAALGKKVELVMEVTKCFTGATTNFGSTLKIFRLTRIVRVAKLSSYSRFETEIPTKGFLLKQKSLAKLAELEKFFSGKVFENRKLSKNLHRK